MGNCFGKKRKIRVVKIAAFGLDDSGKTTIVKALKGEENQHVISTVGFNALEMMQNHMNITIYDLGGGPRIRDIWSNYFSEIFGMIYVIDAHSERRLDETKAAFLKVISHELMRGKPILLLLNKQDKDGAIDEVDAADRLDLQKIVNLYETPCRIETCFGTSGTGKVCDPRIRSGFQWLLLQIEQAYDRLAERVTRDFAQMKARQDTERRERIARIKAKQEAEEMAELAAEHVYDGTERPTTTSPSKQANGNAVGVTPTPDVFATTTTVVDVHNGVDSHNRPPDDSPVSPSPAIQPISYAANTLPPLRGADGDGGGDVSPGKAPAKNNRVLPFEPLPQISEESHASSSIRGSLLSRAAEAQTTQTTSLTMGVTPTVDDGAPLVSQSDVTSDASDADTNAAQRQMQPHAQQSSANRMQTAYLGAADSSTGGLPPISPQALRRLPPSSQASSLRTDSHLDEPNDGQQSLSSEGGDSTVKSDISARKRKRKRLDSLVRNNIGFMNSTEIKATHGSAWDVY